MPHPWQDAQEGLGEHGACSIFSFLTLPSSSKVSLDEGSSSRISASESRLLQGDVVLVGLRDYQDEKADVILK